MKITAGLGSIDDYPSFAAAGADELFCGYIPEWWTKEYGIFSPLNRREVLYYNVQIGSRSEMEILHDMMDVYHVPVSITLNALYYRPEQYPLLEKYILECLELGFDSFILADFALLVYLKEVGLNQKMKIAVSGELSEMNPLVMDLLESFQVTRIIFHRKMNPLEMKCCTDSHNLEFEAFILNEKCHFHGGFCNSLHCDELVHSCLLPYRIGTFCQTDSFSENKVNKDLYSGIFASSHAQTDCCISKKSDESILSTASSISGTFCENLDIYIPGHSGCGLCVLWDLHDAGISYLKVVGRGNYSEEMIGDIKALRKALSLLNDSSSKTEYIRHMKKEIFPHGCSGNCYY